MTFWCHVGNSLYLNSKNMTSSYLSILFLFLFFFISFFVLSDRVQIGTRKCFVEFLSLFNLDPHLHE